MVCRGTLTAFALLLSVLMSRDEPYGPYDIWRHAFAIVGHGYLGVILGSEVKPDDSLGSVCIVSVLDQFEDRKTRTANQFVAEQLQQSCPGTKRLFNLSLHLHIKSCHE